MLAGSPSESVCLPVIIMVVTSLEKGISVSDSWEPFESTLNAMDFLFISLSEPLDVFSELT